jgi:hypothetical protein
MRRISLILLSLSAAVAFTACGSDAASGGSGTAADTTADTKTDVLVGDSADTTADTTPDTSGSDSATADVAEDALPEDVTETAACGDITLRGQCTGKTIEWCDDTGALQTYDCTEGMDDPSQVACQLIDADYGYDCALAEGASCLMQDADGNAYAAFCQGEGAGCAVGATDMFCTSGIGACTEEDIGYCMGDHAVIDCYASQAFTYDCKAFQGTCTEGADGATCEGIPAGGACDDTYAICADGLTCTGASDAAWGTCG